jgi:hypothetical protein
LTETLQDRGLRGAAAYFDRLSAAVAWARSRTATTDEASFALQSVAGNKKAGNKMAVVHVKTEQMPAYRPVEASQNFSRRARATTSQRISGGAIAEPDASFAARGED